MHCTRMARGLLQPQLLEAVERGPQLPNDLRPARSMLGSFKGLQWNPWQKSCTYKYLFISLNYNEAEITSQLVRRPWHGQEKVGRSESCTPMTFLSIEIQHHRPFFSFCEGSKIQNKQYKTNNNLLWDQTFVDATCALNLTLEFHMQQGRPCDLMNSQVTVLHSASSSHGVGLDGRNTLCSGPCGQAFHWPSTPECRRILSGLFAPISGSRERPFASTTALKDRIAA